ncbi:MAG TPA: hypothetical protein VF816_09685 [Rhodocyclaceae bacterium]
MERENLIPGRIYFGVAFGDDELTIPIIHSYEFLGMSEDSSAAFRFRFIGTDDLLELTERQLDIVIGLDELIATLRGLGKANPSIAP